MHNLPRKRRTNIAAALEKFDWGAVQIAVAEECRTAKRRLRPDHPDMDRR